MDTLYTEILIRKLCRQDESLYDIKFTEDEIQEFLKDKEPFLIRAIRSTFKTARQYTIYRIGEYN